MSLKKQALAGMLWTSVQQFSSQGVSFVVSIVLARLLLPSEFGLIAMIGIFVGIGTLLITSGLTQSLIRTTDADQEDFSTVFFFNLGGSILIYLIIFAVAPFIADFYDQDILTPVVRLYCVTFVINAFEAVQMTRLTKLLDFKTQTKINVPAIIFGSFIGIVMAYNGYGVWSLVWMAIAQSTASATQVWIYSKWTPSLVFNKNKFRYHYKYGIKMMFAGVLNITFSNIYTIIIGRVFSPAQVGFFNRADSLKQFPVNNISVVLNKVTFPLFASIQDDDVRLKSVYKKIMQMVIFVVAPTLLILAALAEPLFRFLFTEKWLPAVPYFRILCFNGILYPIHAYNLNILMVKGRSDLFLKLEIFKVFLIIITILLSLPFGIYGLLYGSVVSSILAFFINTYYSGKFLKYTSWEQTKDILPIIIVALLVGAAVSVVDFQILSAYLNDFLRLFVGGLLGVLLFAAIAWVFKMSSLTEIKILIRRK
ncbi:MAG TPA: lipopolysaccharide biosynthesis protein [Flavobacterium sp.]|jgi:O-antigen/teichoic acid export membrane protein